MSAPDIPSSYTVKTIGDPLHPVSAEMSGSISLRVDPTQVTVMMVGDPDRPVGTKADVTMEMANFPRLTLADLYGLIRELKKPNMRMTMPIELNFGVSVFPLTLLGLDALTFSICGQQQVILDEYRPNVYERCEADCVPGKG